MCVCRGVKEDGLGCSIGKESNTGRRKRRKDSKWKENGRMEEKVRASIGTCVADVDVVCEGKSCRCVEPWKNLVGRLVCGCRVMESDYKKKKEAEGRGIRRI